MTAAPLVSACLIVKNEENTLARCLHSVKDFADEIVVVDTGSDDATVAIAEQLGARIFHHAWTEDYAAARNLSLAHAQGEFILYIDADEELHADDRKPLRAVLERNDVDVVEMEIVSRLGGSDRVNVSRYTRVFRNYSGIHFVYPIHEQIWPSLEVHEPRVLRSGFRIVHHGYDADESVLEKKRERNLERALHVLEWDPDNAYYLFHAGLGYLTTGRPRQAMKWLERALRHGREDELPATRNALAQAFFDDNDDAAAEPHLRASVESEPQQFHGWALLAEVLLLGQRHVDAIACLRGLLAVEHSRLHTDVAPHRSRTMLKLGMCELLTHQPRRAHICLRAAVEGTLDGAELETAQRYLAMAERMMVDP